MSCLSSGCSVGVIVCSRSRRFGRSGISRTRQATLVCIYVHPLLGTLGCSVLLQSVLGLCLRLRLSAGRRRRLESRRGGRRRRGRCCRSEVSVHFNLLRCDATNLQGARWSAAVRQPGSGMLDNMKYPMLLFHGTTTKRVESACAPLREIDVTPGEWCFWSYCVLPVFLFKF